MTDFRYLVIVTGPSRSGKDTLIQEMRINFLKLTKKYTTHRSSIESLAHFLSNLGVDRTTPNGRKILAETKTFLDSFDYLYSKNQLKRIKDEFASDTHFTRTYFTQIREKNTIEYYMNNIIVGDIPIVPVVVKVLSKEAIENCPDNHADRESIDVEANFTIWNEGSVEDLKIQAKKLTEDIIAYGKMLYQN